MKFPTKVFNANKKKKIGVCCFMLIILIIDLHSLGLEKNFKKFQNKSYHINVFRDEILKGNDAVVNKRELDVFKEKKLKINDKITDFTKYYKLFKVLKNTIKKYTTYEDENFIILNKAYLTKALQ